jgi:crossover junction endodeoxyribonuclease RuvC
MIIGIDPGGSGGIAWHDGERARVVKMPATLQDLWELMNNIRQDSFREGSWAKTTAYLEQVHSMPGQGVASSFKFGNGFGHLEMALTAAGIPFVRVSPQKWQGALGCRTGGDKNVSKARAQELFPDLKPTHATADALLIMEYGRRQK